MPRKRTTEVALAAPSLGAAPAPKRRRTRPAAAAAAAVDPVPDALAALSAAAGLAAGDSEEIERLAYLYWRERGGQGGSPEDDWFRAEAEVRRRRAQPA